MLGNKRCVFVFSISHPSLFVSRLLSVYKSIRLFRASLESSSQVDDNLEGILNVVFYALLFFLSLFIMGFRVWESLLSVSTFLFGFSFMFGPVSISNHFCFRWWR